MTPLWTAAAAAAATGGGTTGDWAATGVSIDSRGLRPGDLFAALTDRRDGHDFVTDAFAGGAAAAMVARPPAGAPRDRLLIVDDVARALADLGAAARARGTARMIAVTGSVGKTTVKDMLRAALSPQGRTHAAEASHNNRWGVALTLARLPPDAEYAVIEIGMNAPGEIAPLARLARPHVAIVTTVAPAHLGAFGAIEGIAREKADIFDGLSRGGVALANADVGTAPILFDRARGVGARLIRFGRAPGVEARLTEVRLTDGATVLKASLDGVDRLFKLSVPARHLALNAVAALAAAEAAGADATEAALALARWRPAPGRGVRERLLLDPVDNLAVELIDDAFNANPASVAAALEVLADAAPTGAGRRIAVLGDMLELGPAGPAFHAEVADHPAMDRIDAVHTVGPLMDHLRRALPPAKRGRHADSARDMARSLPRGLRAGDVVLVKGSKGIGTGLVVDALRKLGQAVAAHGRGHR